MAVIPYGLDSNSGKVSDEFMRGVKEFNYKSLVIVSYNSTKAVLIATAQHNFSKEMTAGCYIAVDSLANMILPYIPDVQATRELLNKIKKLLAELKEYYTKIYVMARDERAEYVRKCEEVVVYLTPNLSRVGVGATVRAIGTFSYDQILSNKNKELEEKIKMKKRLKRSL